MVDAVSVDVSSAGSDGLSRGHKKRARTQQALIEAALRIYARQDVGSLTMNELAEEAGLANGTIYNYFRSRDEVLEAVGIAMATHLSEVVLVLSSAIENGAHRLVIGLRVYILRAYQEEEWARAVVRVIQLDPGLRGALANYVGMDLRIGREQGLFDYVDEGIAVDCVCAFGLAAMRSIIEGRAVAGCDIHAAEMVLRALGLNAAQARHYANLPIPEAPPVPPLPPARGRGRPRKVMA